MSQSSSVIFLKLLSRRMPALLTRMCTVPNAFTASSMIDLAPSFDDTDALFAIAVPPAARISFTTRSAASPASGAVAAAAEIVDHHFGAAFGDNLQRVRFTEPTARAGDHHHFVFEIAHLISLSLRRVSSCTGAVVGDSSLRADNGTVSSRDRLLPLTLLAGRLGTACLGGETSHPEARGETRQPIKHSSGCEQRRQRGKHRQSEVGTQKK